jgi:hypothetical protein
MVLFFGGRLLCYHKARLERETVKLDFDGADFRVLELGVRTVAVPSLELLKF